jgi:sirohydrochlorin cobaltochelatase
MKDCDVRSDLTRDMVQASNNTMTAAEIDRRLKILLPPEYQDRYEEVQPNSMGSAGLRYGADGRVAWDTIWGSFCDLAMAGGPPHRGTLLEPGTCREAQEEPDKYREVVAEICRGVRLLTRLTADAAPVSGWVRMYCRSEAMAGWLARATALENVSVYVQGSVVCLPAGPSFRVEKEIKNVLTAVAKSTHYWVSHASVERHRQVARLLMEMDRESPLLQPALQVRESKSSRESAHAIADAMEATTGMRCSADDSAGWIRIDAGSVDAAVRMVRTLIVCNILARREENRVLVPHNWIADPNGEILSAGLRKGIYILDSLKGFTNVNPFGSNPLQHLLRHP